MLSPANPPPLTRTQPPTTPARRKQRKKWIIFTLVAVLLAIAGAVAMRKRSAPKSTPVTTEKAVIKTITQSVSATGKIQPETEVKISPEVTGEIVELPFKEGASVTKGALIARIKSDNYLYQLDQSEADLAAARANSLDNKARLQKAEDDLRRSKDLFSKKLISEAEYGATKATFDAAEASFESARAQIRRAEGLVKQARDRLEKTTIYAPIDGTVSARTSEVGERVVGTGQFAGTEIMRIADLANMEVRVNINENDIVNVEVGDKARVTIDAFPNRKFDAIVKEIGSAAKTTGANTQDEVTNFLVKIRVLDKNVPIRPGMSANAEIETQTAENVVAVPIQSVTVRSREAGRNLQELAAEREKKNEETKGEGAVAAVNAKQQKERERADRASTQRVVFVKTGDVVKMTPVETGVSDTSHIEIKSGLKEGDEIVSGSYVVITRTLKDGMAVKLEQPKKGKSR